MCTPTTEAEMIIGLAIDADLLTLDQVLDLVRSCSNAQELGAALKQLVEDYGLDSWRRGQCSMDRLSLAQWWQRQTTPQPPRRFVIIGGDW